MNQQYDATTSIENLDEQIEQAWDVAISANAPYNEEQILKSAYFYIQHECFHWNI